MIHVGALPGTPANTQTVAKITAQAVREAIIYRDCGIDGIIIENMHDVPYLRRKVGPEIVAAMAIVGHAVKTESKLPVGIQIVGRHNDDWGVLQMGYAFEQATNVGKRQPPIV